VGEFEAAQAENADRPEAAQALALFSLAQGDPGGAESRLRNALQRHPRYLPLRVNLADLLRQTGRDALGEPLLEEGLQLVPGNADLVAALALTLVRQGRKPEAQALLARAAASPAAPPRLVYLQALMLADAGRRRAAIVLLARASAQVGERDLLLALAGLRRQEGDAAGATAALSRLAAVNPDDPALTAAGRP